MTLADVLGRPLRQALCGLAGHALTPVAVEGAGFAVAECSRCGT